MGAPPPAGTPEHRLWVAALAVAIRQPLARPGALAAKVPWPLVVELRAALEAVGVDWEAAKLEGDYRRRAEKSG